MDNCFCKLFKIQRADGNFLQIFKEDLQKPALYILLNREEGKAYVGETDAFLTRIQQHISRKEFWVEALAFTASDDSLSKTEVQYLEYLAYDKAFVLRDALYGLPHIDTKKEKGQSGIEDIHSGLTERDFEYPQTDFYKFINGERVITKLYNHKNRYNNERDIEIYRRLPQGATSSHSEQRS